MNLQRRQQLRQALSLLPRLRLPRKAGKNGEELATDEAAVWKRVLNFRVAVHLKAQSIFESHPGFGISTRLYKHANPTVQVFKPESSSPPAATVDLVDIDPFGQPWDFLGQHAKLLQNSRAIMVTNGEAYAVVRNWPKAQRFPSQYSGAKMPHWVTKEYIPRLEDMIKQKCRFFYAFPTSVRSIHSRRPLPKGLFADCPQWMWWLASRAPR